MMIIWIPTNLPPVCCGHAHTDHTRLKLRILYITYFAQVKYVIEQ